MKSMRYVYGMVELDAIAGTRNPIKRIGRTDSVMTLLSLKPLIMAIKANNHDMKQQYNRNR